MGMSMSPVLRQELANLEKDDDSRKSAMKALNSYVEDLDSKEIPLFLSQVSDTGGGLSSGEYTISLYEALARVHGPKIVSQIDNIMSSIVKTLTTSGGSFPLQQACSKVVRTIARYAIEPTNSEEKKRGVIRSLCKPLLDCLWCKQESLSCGIAFCLISLVDSENWRFACDDMVNEVCLKLAGVLEDRKTQTNSHMGLVMSLAKNNSLIVEAYAHIFIRAGLRILNYGQTERNSQKRLAAIQMVHSLMNCLDIRSIFQELGLIIGEMEKFQSDEMPRVKRAAFDALETAKRLLVEKGSKIIDSDVISVTGSNFSRQTQFSRSQCGSPESQTLDSFVEYKSFAGSPLPITQASGNGIHTRKNVNRKLWNHENGCVDISLKDGLFSQLARGGSRSHSSSEQDESLDTIRRGYDNGFPGFVLESPANAAHRSRNSSPQRTRSQINVDDIRIYSTPRRLICSLQDDDDENSDYPKNQTRRLRSPCSAKCMWTPMSQYVEHPNRPRQRNRYEDTTDSESVLSSEDCAGNTDGEVQCETKCHGENKPQRQKLMRTSINLLVFIMLIVSAVFALVLLFGGGDESLNAVPT